MSVSTNYFDMVDAIKKYYGADSSIYEDVLKHGIFADNFPSVAKQAGIDVVTNAKGDIISYSVKQDITSGLPEGWDIANNLNSNIQSGTANNVFNINKVSGTKVIEEEGKKIVKETPITKYTNGVKGVLNRPVRGTVAPAVIAVASGIQLGKGIDSAIYKIGNAMGLNPPENLNPETWKSLVSELPDEGLSGAYKFGFNTLFGFDESTNAGQMYLDENALAYMAQYLNTIGLMNITSGYTNNDYINNTSRFNYKWWRLPLSVSLNGMNLIRHYYDSSLGKDMTETRTISATGTSPVYCVVLHGNSRYSRGPFMVSKESFTTSNGSTAFHTVNDYIGVNFYCYRGASIFDEYDSRNYYEGIGVNDVDDTLYSFNILDVSADLYKLITQGTYNETPEINGVSTIVNATIPDLSNVSSITGMLTTLKSTFPSLWENRVEQEVAQPDGSTKTFTFVPIAIPSGGEGLNPDSSENTQTGTEILPGTSTDTQLNSVIQFITQLGSLIKGMQKTDVNLTSPPINPPDTGSGNVPSFVPITGSASSLYAIYNPTLAQLNSLGAWLWSSDFIDQILKLFSDPMQAIIGLHKVFATPATGAEQNIKVGYLDSGVPSKIVTDQYTTIDCGTVDCAEYFGNVFDYSPYTNIQIYLPFIGIVDLNTSDVMRSKVHVVYHVDVLSGACLAEIKITRDNYGGTLYQYAGNASVTMPISSGSYIGVISNVVGVAARAVSGFAVGGAAGAAVGGVSGALSSHSGTQVQHSGGFSGNAGAMGIKKPYLIIERPQTEIAEKAATLQGYGSNKYVALSECVGYTRVKAVHVDKIEKASRAEKDMIEEALKSGVIFK